MGKVDFVKAARKNWTCQKCGKPIDKGTSYYRGEVNFGPTFIRCTECKLEPWEVTSSDYQRAIGRLVAKWQEEYSLDEDGRDQLIDDLEALQDEQQEKLDNMPEQLQDSVTGQLLQDRIDGLECAKDALSLIDIDDLKEQAVNYAIDSNEYEVEEYPDYQTVMDGNFGEEIKQDAISEFEYNLTSDIEDALGEIDW